VPPLRERSRDIAPLTLHFIEKSLAGKGSLASRSRGRSWSVSRGTTGRATCANWRTRLRRPWC
jgi:hypothetical protein